MKSLVRSQDRRVLMRGCGRRYRLRVKLASTFLVYTKDSSLAMSLAQSRVFALVVTAYHKLLMQFSVSVSAKATPCFT